MKHLKTLPVLFFMLYITGVAFAQDADKGIIAGQLMIRGGGPLAGGRVFLFNDASGPPPSQVKYWRVPDYIAQIDEAGKFSLELPAGKYYLGAIKRISGEKIGPPEDGDYFFASTDEKGLPQSYVVEPGKTRELGVISEAAPFRKRAAAPGDEMTAIEGTVLTHEGIAVEGALVLVQLTPLNTGRHPLFTSERTGKDGHYLVRVHDGGSYYLRVRSMDDKGPPAAREMVGAYGGREPLAVVVKKGQIIKGIDITVVRFAGRGTVREQNPRSSGRQQSSKVSN